MGLQFVTAVLSCVFAPYLKMKRNKSRCIDSRGGCEKIITIIHTKKERGA